MISRRSFLSAAPVAVMAAPQIARALPAPMPVVDAGPFPTGPYKFLGSDNPRTLSRIWHHTRQMQDGVQGRILASVAKARMEDIVEKVTGHRPPFILRAHDDSHNEFIFHKVMNRINHTNLEGPIVNQPCFLLEWFPEAWDRVTDRRPNQEFYLEPMTAFVFRHGQVIYDL